MGTKRRSRHPRLRVDAPALLTVLVLVLAVAAAGFMGRLTAEPVIDAPVATATQESTAEPTPIVSDVPEPVPDAERLVISGDTAAGAILLLVTIGLALLVRLLLRIGQRPERDGSPEPTGLQQAGSPALVDDVLPSWTEDAERALTGSADTSDAVIRCWLAFEDLCAAAGVVRTPAQTTSDFAATAASALDLPPRPLTALNRLYQRARFGASVPPLHATAPGTTTRNAAGGHLDAADREMALAGVRALSAAVAARTGTAQ